MSKGEETDSRKRINSEFMMKGAGLKAVKLNEPNKERGFPFMETLSMRASALEWSDRDLSLQDISVLLWAATGLKTNPHAAIDKGLIKNLLKLSDTQHVLLNHPVGYSE